MEQKLTVNCATCDARTVAEETLQAYEQITINCATLLVSPQSQILMDQYHVAINCAKVLRLDPNAVLKTVNGTAVITPGPAPVRPLYLIVNGSLTIKPGTQEVLAGYAGITVNGSLLAPKGMEAYIPALNLNGSAGYYPDEAILLKRTAIIDSLFPLRAKADKLYWAARRLVFLDSALDIQALAEKKVRFSAPTALIAQSLAAGIVPLLTDETEIELVPDGMRLIGDDLELTSAALRRYGPKLYVLGDLTLTKESGEVLPQVEQLIVKGDVSLPKSLSEDFAQIPAQYHELHIVRGRVIEDRPQVQLTRAMLELEPEGLTVRDCARVRLDADIPEALVLERLSISDCVEVICAPEQKSALDLVAQDVLKIRTADEAPAESGEECEAIAKEPNQKVINTADYIL